MRRWTLDELAAAPLMIAGRVDRIAHPPGQECEAVIRALRAFPARDSSTPLRILFRCYDNSRPGGGTSRMYAPIEPGDVSVFALRPDGRHWRLIAEEGFGLVLPARTAPPPAPAPPESAREFLLRELTACLLDGSHAERYRAGLYLRDQHGSGYLPELWARALAAPAPARFDIACALLATLGLPRQSLEEMAQKAAPGSTTVLIARLLAGFSEPERSRGVVRNLLRHSATHDWGTAATLVPSYKDHPLLHELLPGYLERDQKGALSVAWWLVRNGRPDAAPAALPAALRRIGKPPGARFNDFYAACGLVTERGSEEQFGQFLALLQSADTAQSLALWNGAISLAGPRKLRVLDVLLADQRIAAGDMRLCDLAGGHMQSIAGVKFGFREWNQPRAERDQALDRARAWRRRRAPAEVRFQ